MNAEASNDLNALREQLKASKAARSASAQEQVAQAQKCSTLPMNPTRHFDGDKINGVAKVNGQVNGAVAAPVEVEPVDQAEVTQARQLRKATLNDLKRTSFGVRTSDALRDYED